MATNDERATVEDMVDALLVFDEPILNSRYHGMLYRHPEGRMPEELARLPGLILKAGRVARSGSEKWMRLSTHVLDDPFLAWGERTLMESFLGMIESQLRLIAYMARAAPTREIRSDFDEMAHLHRKMAGTLREGLVLLVERLAPQRETTPGTRAVQEEDPSGDLRGQIEDAIRVSTSAGHAIRVIMLSPTGLRHLRDQGCFQDGDPTLGGAPVVVDLGWDAPAFALLTFDAVPLEEILQDARVGDDLRTTSSPGAASPGNG